MALHVPTIFTALVSSALAAGRAPSGFPALVLSGSLLAGSAPADTSEPAARTTFRGNHGPEQLFAELGSVSLQSVSRSRARFVHVVDLLRPLYDVLPKNKAGGIDQAVARYALHRHFSARRGWHIQGIDPGGTTWSETSSAAKLRTQVPNPVLDLLEERWGYRYIGIDELAELVVTIEDYVHGNTIELLAKVYRALNLSVDEPLVEMHQAELVLKLYSLYAVLPWARGVVRGAPRVEWIVQTAQKLYPGWDDMMMWVEDLKETIRFQSSEANNPFAEDQQMFRSFRSIASLVELFSVRFGQLHDLECRLAKNRLLDLEGDRQNDGRILLAKFYGPLLEGQDSIYSESPDYLRQLGALDSTNASMPNVIVPNYLYSASRCLAASGFHSICCLNQCDALMAVLERKLAGPFSDPYIIAELVARLPSETVAAPRNLSRPLMRRLGEIARRHGGEVPLHGRMFAQWMHHAFPNECPYPHAAGVRSRGPASAKKQSASVDEVRELVRLANVTAHEVGTWSEAEDLEEEPDLPWTEEEVLLTETLPLPGSRCSWACMVLWPTFAIAAFGSTVWNAFYAVRSHWLALGAGGAKVSKREAPSRHLI